jgi:Holliday junction resolvase RusA-like endonuclease
MPAVAWFSMADDKYIEAFEAELSKDPYEVPPITGELHLSIDVPTVSLQGKKTARDALAATLQEETKKYAYLLSGDISLDITLQVHQRDRYESDASPDLDNFLKPLLDSLAGPDGLLIDDCQVRTLSIDWISWVREDTRIELFFRYIDGEYVNKKGLLFVQIEGPLCMPVDTSLPLMQQRILFSHMKFSFRQRKRLEKYWDYYAASSVLPIQRRFHRTRINGFPVKSAREYKRDVSLLKQLLRKKPVA